MASVSIRELRNGGGQVVDRVAAGEHITITRSGKAVAELRPMRQAALTSAELLNRRRRLPPLDLGALRRDLDLIIDPSI